MILEKKQKQMSQLHDLEENGVPLSGHLIGKDLSNVWMLPVLKSPLVA